MADTPIAVIGGGVVGLAVAARLAPRNPDLVLLERHSRHGMETSSRNSQVIHAGIYYFPGSLKARLCLEGNARIYALCAARGIPHRRTGKLIIATAEEELGSLDALCERALRNGAHVERITGARARSIEPRVPSAGAIWSESSGVVDAHGLMDVFLADARDAGAIVHTDAELVALEAEPGGYRLTVRHGRQLEAFTAERVVNAAGLEADTVAGLAGIDVERAGYRQHYCKGSYFSASTRCRGLVSHLVYPVPSAESLGVHAVLDVAGRLRFGPDAEYLAERTQDYRVDPARRAAFGRAARRLLPDVRDEDLEPDISGIRPKLQGPGGAPRDFVIAEEKGRGLPGFYDLIGIESPGLTAAPAIAEHVARMIESA
jgi:L-2-hydroxyglutarate oxidase LhgO